MVAPENGRPGQAGGAFSDFPGTNSGDRVGLRERKKARTRIDLMTAAVALFHEKGFAETTIDDIVQRADYSRSTFFRYFETKDDVVYYGKDPQQLDADLRQGLEANGGKDPWGVVRRVLGEDTVEMIVAAPTLLADCIHLWATEPALVRRRWQWVAETVDVVANFLSEHLVGGEHGTFDAQLLGKGAVGVTTAVLGVDHDSRKQIEEQLDRGFDYMERGFAAWRSAWAKPPRPASPPPSRTIRQRKLIGSRREG